MIKTLIVFIIFGVLIFFSSKIKKSRLRNAIQFFLLASCVICIAITAYQSHLSTMKKGEEERNKFRGMFFKGSVIGSYTKNGSSLLGIRLDSTNTASYYEFNRHTALMIRDNVAILPIGMIDKNDSKNSIKMNAEYVIVDDENFTTTYIAGDDTLTAKSSFWPGKLEEIHLLIFAEELFIPKRALDNI